MNFFDLHTDTPLKLLQGCAPLQTAGFSGSAFGRYAAVRAAWLKGDEPHPLQRCHQLLRAQRLAEQAVQHPRRKTVYMVENAGFLAQNPARLLTLYRWGVRALSLTWNGENRLAGGALSSGSLTPAGQSVLQKAEQLGMAVDLSHLNHQSARAAVKLLHHPLVTHACCYAVCPNPRNLPDDVLLLVAARGGVIGLCLYPPFLGGDPFKMLPLHLNHLLRLGLGSSVAIGTDFDGAEMHPGLQQNGNIPALYRHLADLGFKKKLLNAFFYQNALAFWGKMCKNKRDI